MKRPLAVVGFSMLATFFIVSQLEFAETVAIIAIAAVLFLVCLAFRKAHKNIFFMTILASVIVFSTCFIFAQNQYMSIQEKGTKQKITGTVIESRQTGEKAFTCVIKVKGECYKIRYVSEEKRFNCGDMVSGTVILNVNDSDRDYFESTLSSKVYFTCFERDGSMLNFTGNSNRIYSAINVVKEWFVDVVSLYLPGDNGEIVKAMSIGDRNGLTEDITMAFNYSGTSHLLVVSGLHLSLWALWITSFLQKKERFRRFTPIIGLFSILGYSLLAGYGVSVVRALIMVAVMLLGKLIKRDWDSLNSIGCALVIILLANPFAPYSASLWFTVMSTAGILICADPLQNKILHLKVLKPIKQKFVLKALVSSMAISISTSIFTALVFITQFNLMPIASIFSNLLSVTPAMVLMVSTVAGTFCHLLGATGLSHGLFSLAGVIGEFLQRVAEIVGKSEYSTISVASPVYKYFLIFALICIAIAFVFKNKRETVLKGVSVVLSITFVLLSQFAVSKDYNNLTVHISNEKGTPLIILNHGDDVTMVGDFSVTQSKTVRDIITTHNKKEVDNIFIVQDDEKLMANLSAINELDFSRNAKINEKNDFCELYEKENSTLIIYKNVKILLINDKPYENCFENFDEYDIIITNMQDEGENAHFSAFLKNEDSHLINIAKGEKVTITC